jgi:Tol biopolymer transport system component
VRSSVPMIALVSAAQGILLVAPDAPPLISLTQSGYSPSWSPDAQRFAYYTIDLRTFLTTVRVRDLHHKTTTPILTGVRVGALAWSPDGTRIAFSLIGATSEFYTYLFTMHPDGTNIQQLTTTGRDYDPNWSPDSTQIVFRSARAGLSGLYVMQADGTNQRHLAQSQSGDSHPAWSPDGQQIAFIGYWGSSYALTGINADGSGRTRLAPAPYEAYYNSTVSWSPDGRRIAYVGIYTDQDGRAGILNIINLDGSGNDQHGLGVYDVLGVAWAAQPPPH